MVQQIRNVLDLLLYLKGLIMGEFVSFAECFMNPNPGILKLYYRVRKWEPRKPNLIEQQALERLGIYPHSVCEFIKRLPDEACKVLYRILKKLGLGIRFFPVKLSPMIFLPERGMVNRRGLVPAH